jgi:glycosyltransferase involved in cell wall biosynthesis
VGYRILYHHRTQALDGQRVHIKAIQHALTALGHEVIEVAPLPAIEKAGVVPVRTWQRRLLHRAATGVPKALYEALELAYNLVGYRALSTAIRRVKPDFIYERYAMNTVAGVWSSKRHNIPLLLEVNAPLVEEKRRLGQLFFHRLSERLERYTFVGATRVLAVTGVLADMVRRSADIAAERVRVVHNGVDPASVSTRVTARESVRSNLTYFHDEIVIGAVGFFREWHGIDALLRAFALQHGSWPSTRILLVGDGPAIPALKQLAADLGVANHVTFVGAVPHDDVPIYLAAMDIVVISRAVDYASPLKLFEYMAAGKALVAPRQPNLLEVLTENRDALCFEPEREDELARVLTRMIQNPGLRNSLGAAARATIARRQLTWAGNAERIIEAFEQLTPAVSHEGAA